jgi:hypothetical protein
MAVARSLLNNDRMTSTIDFLGQSEFRVNRATFWQRIFNAEELRNSNNFEKLLAGCEIIAVLDGEDLLAA